MTRLGFCNGLNLIIFISCLNLVALAGCEKPKAAVSVKKEAPPAKSAPLSEKERQAKEYQDLKDNYAKLERDYNNLSLDRDNLINQAKSLLGNKGRAEELEGILLASKKESAIFEKDNNDLVNKNLGLEEKCEKLETDIGRLRNEKKRAEDLLAKERHKSQIKRLEQENVQLMKELNAVKLSLNQFRSESGRYKDLSARAQSSLESGNKSLEAKIEELDKLRLKVETLNKAYSEAVKKNREMERRVLSTPGKFAELARQNKTLIRQTANMHYNLGVFYTKNKEYTRAVAEFEKALELKPDDDYSHFNIGYIYAEYLVNRPKAVEHFRHFLRLTKSSDKDVDWVKKYILTWQSWAGKEPME